MKVFVEDNLIELRAVIAVGAMSVVSMFANFEYVFDVHLDGGTILTVKVKRHEGEQKDSYKNRAEKSRDNLIKLIKE